MTTFLYRLFIRIYPFIIRVVSPFNQKAKLWSNGRKGILDRIEKAISPSAAIIWFHCSSLGEFEQGRPVIEKLRLEYPSYQLLLTFFSPSGYEVRKDYRGANYIFYLPMDSPENATRFFAIVNPRLVIFVKYEFWYYYLREARQRNVPLLLISSVFRKSQPFFKSYGSMHREMLSCFSHVFVQNNESLQLLNAIGVRNVSISGDTRFDRVIEIAEQFEPIVSIQHFCGDANVVVAGSTWTEDDKELAHFSNSQPAVRFIIAPHNVIKDRLHECLKLYKNSILFSSITNAQVPGGMNTIIIDNIGLLSRLYKYSTVSFVGGGFGADGVHNVLEAAVYGKPVVFGPEYEKFIEADGLIESGGARSVDNALELEAALKEFLQKGREYEDACKASYQYVYSQQGAAGKILRYIQENRLLTN